MPDIIKILRKHAKIFQESMSILALISTMHDLGKTYKKNVKIMHGLILPGYLAMYF